MPALEDPDILRAILESIHAGVYFVGHDQRIQLWNEGAERITGYLRQDVVGHFCKVLFPPQNEEDEAGMCEIGAALAGVLRDGKPTWSDVSIRHRAGHQVLLRVWAVPVRGSDGGTSERPRVLMRIARGAIPTAVIANLRLTAAWTKPTACSAPPTHERCCVST
jgi:PAS domain S-box-containing protein